MSSKRFSAHLVEVRVWLRLPNPIEVSDVDELEVEHEARIGHAELWLCDDMRQTAQALVAPVVETGNAAAHKVKKKPVNSRSTFKVLCSQH